MNISISKIKKCVDVLTAKDKKVLIKDHIMYILSSLGSEYETVVFVITTKTRTQAV